MNRLRPWRLLPLPLLMAGCKLVFPAPTPMRATWRHSERCESSQTIVALLPGRGDSADDFDAHGFLDALARSDVGVDAVAVDATMGYYLRGSVVNRVFEDVIAPARKKGYSRIWLAGISMGAMGALLTAEQDHRDIEGILLMGAYLGDEDVIDEVASHGGLAGYTPPKVRDPADYQRNVWRWLKRYAESPNASPKLYLGFGTEDRFVRSDELLAAALPADHVFRVKGKHAWGPWSEIFNAFLASGALAPPGCRDKEPRRGGAVGP